MRLVFQSGARVSEYSRYLVVVVVEIHTVLPIDESLSLLACYTCSIYLQLPGIDDPFVCSMACGGGRVYRLHLLTTTYYLDTHSHLMSVC